MAIYAVIENEVISNVVVVDELVVLSAMFPDATFIEVTDETGPAFVDGDFYNGKFRMKKPFDSWVFDEIKLQWVAPKPEPTPDLENNIFYGWDEQLIDWVQLSTEEPSV